MCTAADNTVNTGIGTVTVTVTDTVTDTVTVTVANPFAGTEDSLDLRRGCRGSLGAGRGLGLCLSRSVLSFSLFLSICATVSLFVNL
jgi:hypothetical protein